MSLCESCRHRHESRAAVVRFVQLHGGNPPPGALILDATPEFECKQHEGYSVDPPMSRERCDDFEEVDRGA